MCSLPATGHERRAQDVVRYAGWPGDDWSVGARGSCDYSHPLAGILTHCERHNMLVPYGTPECPLPHDVKPIGEGDETTFQAEIDAAPGWEPYCRRWLRTWDSQTPNVLTIRDEYELAAGEGVEFYWQTRLSVELDGYP